MRTIWVKLSKFAAMTLLIMQLVVPTQGMAESLSDPAKLNQPSAAAMVLDGLVVRPVMLGVTVLGTALFIVTSPFSLLGGNAEDAADELMIKPAKMTFIRCLGCSTLERKYEVVEQKTEE
ncbi:hypothetical protein [Litoribacillus peritrichatus]|uniref:Multidrug transporter n=1 Tax=Litoribacillus peritrichatus TaxID=718191 RepID=A0ABP7NEH6_9GAMM